jgi:hypothetical protein
MQGGQTIGRTPVTVSDGNVDGVLVQASAPLEIAGKIATEGDEQAQLTGSVYLQPVEGFGFGVQPASIQKDGTFKLQSVSREKYSINVTGLPEGAYLKQARAGGSDVLENGLDLSHAESAPPLEILVSKRGATIEGVVRNEDKPWPGAAIMLLPEPHDPARLRRLQKISSSDHNGRFALKGVAPGEYRLYAWEEYVNLIDVEPEQLKPYEEFAVEIKVGEEAHE